MHTGEVLTDAYGRIRGVAYHAAEGLSGDDLAFRPDPRANSIGWLVWHLTRIQDDHVSEIADREQAWTAQGWHEALGLPLDAADTGFGHTAEQVDAVRFDGPGDLLAYHDAVTDRTLEYLATIDAGELDRVIDASYDPPTTVGVRLVSVLSDNLQHGGQAGYLRGLLERRGG